MSWKFTDVISREEAPQSSTGSLPVMPPKNRWILQCALCGMCSKSTGTPNSTGGRLRCTRRARCFGPCGVNAGGGALGCGGLKANVGATLRDQCTTEPRRLPRPEHPATDRQDIEDGPPIPQVDPGQEPMLPGRGFVFGMTHRQWAWICSRTSMEDDSDRRRCKDGIRHR